MEILNNFSSIYCFIAFVIGAMFMLAMLSIAAMGKNKESRNKVHFYVTRDVCGSLELWLGVPHKTTMYYFSRKPTTKLLTHGDYITDFGLKPSKYDRLMFNDKPVEVFLNLED